VPNETNLNKPYECLNDLGPFTQLKYLELNTPLREAMAPYPWGYVRRATYRDWVDASIAEDTLRYVSAQMGLHQTTSALYTQLVQLDIKVGKWEPYLKDYRLKSLKDNSIYTCWREAGVQSKLHTIHLACKSWGSVFAADDSMYEEAMCSAGLWDSAEAEMGQALW
jgi:hypothetical protein